jgi:hypothetical protein
LGGKRTGNQGQRENEKQGENSAMHRV